ncbi:MAG: manganese efflux pump [Oscillospiraceae bacterium]|nr:manganese efflux pump [Oscillospiraceae bacterium]
MQITELILLAAGLAMDACAVSLTNGLRFPQMHAGWLCADGLCFGLMQGMMPLIGFLLGSCFFVWITAFDRWLALILLGLIGLKMVIESRRAEPPVESRMTLRLLLIQGIATSIDALAVGVSFAAFRGFRILPAVSMIAAITAAASMAGVLLGKRFGAVLDRKAELLGGMILILLGIRIFLS